MHSKKIAGNARYATSSASATLLCLFGPITRTEVFNLWELNTIRTSAQPSTGKPGSRPVMATQSNAPQTIHTGRFIFTVRNVCIQTGAG